MNIQPWHFLVADNPTAKERIAKALTGRYAYNAPKVLESSHTLVFCTRTDISPEYLNQLLEQDDLSGRFKDEKAKLGQRILVMAMLSFTAMSKRIYSAGWKIKLLSL